MHIEEELRLKKILEREQRNLIDFLDCCSSGEIPIIDETTVAESIKDIDIIERYLYGKAHFKSIEPNYTDFLGLIRKHKIS